MSKSARTFLKILPFILAWWVAILIFVFLMPLLEKNGCSSAVFCRYNDGWAEFKEATLFALWTLPVPAVLVWANKWLSHRASKYLLICSIALSILLVALIVTNLWMNIVVDTYDAWRFKLFY